jgi:hypothetical protein
MSNVNKTISQLSENLEAVKPIQNPIVRTIKWLIFGFSYAIILPFFLELRYDIGEKLTQPMFLAELTLAVIGSIFACLAATFLSTPDSYQKPYIKWFATLPFIALTALLVTQLVRQKTTSSETIATTLNTYQCFTDMLAFAVFPILVMVILARKGASTKQSWSGAMISLSAVNFSYIALRIIEPNDSAEHLLLWHYAPMIITALIGIMLGRRLLKW